jgi:hypothetical protein
LSIAGGIGGRASPRTRAGFDRRGLAAHAVSEAKIYAAIL